MLVRHPVAAHNFGALTRVLKPTLHDNVWVADVALHQVYKLSHEERLLLRPTVEQWRFLRESEKN